MQSKLPKILVPILMVAVVAAIWFTQREPEVVEDPTVAFPLNISEVNLEELNAQEMPIIIDFGADECIPCKEMAPVLVTLNEEMQGKAIVQFVDVWKNPTAAQDFPVQVIPTQIIINSDGTPYVPSENIGIEFIQYMSIETEEHIFTAHQGGLTEEQMRLILADMGVS